MPTQQKEVALTQEFWDQLVDSKICGGYLLRRWISTNKDSAVYFTNYGEEPAALKLTSVPPADKLPEFQQPHITRLFEEGDCEIAGARLHYYLTEYAEENLASVIADRALTPDEAQEVAGPVLDALAFLHSRSLVHGSVKPSNILAKGDTIKLAVDPIRPIGEGGSPEEDMLDFGLSLAEVLTQRREAAAIPPLPQPLRDILEHTLHPDPAQRWTARQAVMRLSGKVPPAAAPAPVADVKPQHQATTASPAPVRAVSPGFRFPRWTLPAAGGVMLLAVVYVLARGPAPQPQPTPQNTAPAPVAQQPLPPPKPAPFDNPPRYAPPKAVQAPVMPKTAPATARPDARGWFVVVASYSREADAVQRAQSFARRFPQFRLAVFPPSAIDTHYLVILGSGLSPDAAETLRQRAVASGLPPDTYIKKYPTARP